MNQSGVATSLRAAGSNGDRYRGRYQPDRPQCGWYRPARVVGIAPGHADYQLGGPGRYRPDVDWY
jgi:hypothetical protein